MLNVKCQRFIIWSFSLSLYVYNTVFIFRTNLMRRRIKCCYANNAIQTEKSKFKMMILFIESARIEFVLFLIFSLHSHGHLYLYVFIHFCSGDYSVCSFVDDFLRYLFWFLGLKNFWHNQLITEAEEIVALSGQIYCVFCFLLYYIVLHWEIDHEQRLCVN